MKEWKVFIDGSAGTTGLKILERLQNRKDIVILSISDDKRKDLNVRKKIIEESDLTFLCLPDSASKEIVDSLDDGCKTIIIDTSTFYRTDSGWAYAFPELDNKFRENIKKSRRIANPGCHASGFVSLVYPLIKENIIKKDSPLTCFSVTGYSGGGKKMIGDYSKYLIGDGFLNSPNYFYPQMYALGQNHKHLKEMKGITGIATQPVFTPIVCPYYSGMMTVVPIHNSFFINKNKGILQIKEMYRKKYNSKIVSYIEDIEDISMLNPGLLSGKDKMNIYVCGNEERLTLVSIFDNLGKGACGSAIQAMNIAFGIDETSGLNC